MFFEIISQSFHKSVMRTLSRLFSLKAGDNDEMSGTLASFFLLIFLPFVF